MELCPNSTEAPRIHPRRGGNADASRPIPGADRLIEPILAQLGVPGGRLHHRPVPSCQVNDSRIGLQGSDGPDEFNQKVWKIKNLALREEKTVGEDGVISSVRTILSEKELSHG